jgi:hypothetical protein
MVAYEEENGDTTRREAIYAPGEFPLLSLSRLTALVGVTAKKDKVNAVFYGKVYNLVKDF